MCSEVLAAQSGRVTGLVHDSLSHAPLGGAAVQIVSADAGARVGLSVRADSVGRFAFDSVPPGRYMLGYHHPMLDTLGIEATVREIRVSNARETRADLGIPSASRMRTAICTQAAFSDSGGMILGSVRDAQTLSPIGGATVRADWSDLAVTPRGLQRLPRHVIATAGSDNGWFAICNVPTGGTITLTAIRGADTTALIELRIPTDGFTRRDMYLGSSRAMVSGVVVTNEGQPITSARVVVAGATETRTNTRGEFVLANALSGTRMLEVRAVGYYPDFRPVNVIPGIRPFRIALVTMKSVLDTIHVKAAALTRAMIGFEDRRRTSGGKFITGEQLERLRPFNAEQIFQNAPTLKIEKGAYGTMLTMRSLFVGDFINGAAEQTCGPAVYVDGMRIPGAGLNDSTLKPRPVYLEDIDSWVRADQIAGIEIYTSTNIPAEFAEGMNGCGAVVIWRKR